MVNTSPMAFPANENISDSTAAGDDTAVAQVTGVHHAYGDTQALGGVDLRIDASRITALLGPNGSGKTTLFRLLCTLLPLQKGDIKIVGSDVASQALAVRQNIGIVFQSPSLDAKLTVDENLACQAALYGIAGRTFQKRRDEVLESLGIKDRRGEYCEKLSGGLKRRAEIAKSLLHRPRLMLLDEPSTGLDPAARRSLWKCLTDLAEQGTAVLLTTHLIEEADKADQVVIFSAGKKVAEGPPHELRGQLGSRLISLVVADPDAAADRLRDEFGLTVLRTQDSLKISSDVTPDLVGRIADFLGDSLQSITLGRPSLEDVFVARTGVHFDA